MTKLILHIPHSSDKMPNKIGYVDNKNIIENEILKLTDWYTDDLFSCDDSIVVRADFSRIFCDAERFSNDKQEVMAKFGMGVLYERTDDGSLLRTVNNELRSNVLDGFYWPHHEKLTQEVEQQLKLNKKALIIDCHSFPSNPLVRDLDQNNKRPDFNIGTDTYHTPKYLIELSKKFFNQRGYSLGVDWPYSGTIVPLNHYKKTRNVKSIMLEINRALYLNEPGNKKSNNYLAIKKVVTEYLKTMKTACNKI